MQKLRKKATLSVLLILAVLTIGALVMAAIEGWGTIDSIYWACVTITTGEFAPIFIQAMRSQLYGCPIVDLCDL